MMKCVHGKVVGLALLAATAMGLTGCMTTPGDYENIGRVTDDVHFEGFVVEPNRTIRIQARVPGPGNWETIGWARSGDRAISYSGSDWYNWSRSLRVPAKYWIYLDGHHWAEVRAVDYLENEPLYTFKAGFYSYFDFDVPLLELWAEHGHGQSVTIAAD